MDYTKASLPRKLTERLSQKLSKGISRERARSLREKPTPEAEIRLPNAEVKLLRATIELIRSDNPVLALSLQNKLAAALKAPSSLINGDSISPPSHCDLLLDRYLLQRIADTAADASKERVKTVLTEGDNCSISLEDTLNILEFWHRHANASLMS